MRANDGQRHLIANSAFTRGSLTYTTQHQGHLPSGKNLELNSGRPTRSALLCRAVYHSLHALLRTSRKKVHSSPGRGLDVDTSPSSLFKPHKKFIAAQFSISRLGASPGSFLSESGLLLNPQLSYFLLQALTMDAQFPGAGAHVALMTLKRLSNRPPLVGFDQSRFAFGQWHLQVLRKTV